MSNITAFTAMYMIIIYTIDNKITTEQIKKPCMHQTHTGLLFYQVSRGVMAPVRYISSRR